MKVTSTDIKDRLLTAGVELAEKHGFQLVLRHMVAQACGVSEGCVSYHWKNDMTKLRNAIVTEAIRTENLVVIGQALAAGHPYMANVPDGLRQRAVRKLAAS